MSEANDKMLAVQECYISVCKEKDTLEQSFRNREKEEALNRENEVHMVAECVDGIRSTWTLLIHSSKHELNLKMKMGRVNENLLCID